MVHDFEFNGKYYLFDTVSSSLHVCDALTAEVIKKMQGKEYNIDGVDNEAVKEIEAEITELKEKGLLLTEDKNIAPKKGKDLKALCLHICHDCNLRCKYCFAEEGAYKGKREMMSFEVAKNAIDFLIANSGTRKILETDFFGGEPLLNIEVVKQTVEYAKAQAAKCGKTFLFTLTTNGVLLDGETADFLNNEMENVVLSLDGRQEVHDKVRVTANGKGSYGLIIDKFKRFVEKRGNKQYYIRGTFTKNNLDFSNDVLFIADNGFKEISLEPVVLPDGNPLKIADDDLEKIKSEYKILAEKYLERKKNGKGFNFFHFEIDLEGGPCLQKRVNACGAGNEYLSVTPNGDLYPCHQFADNPKFKMGNVFDKTIDENIRKIFHDSSLFTREGCENCFAKYHCSGGCAANNYNFNGDINKPYKPTCEMMKSRLECALHIYSEMKNDGENSNETR